MKRTLNLVAILGVTLGGIAYAGHGHGGGHGRGGGGVVVRDHRSGPTTVVVRDHRSNPRVTHVRVSGGRYVFPGGVVRVYKKPVIRERYYDVHMRPALIVEAYDPVPGYVWVAGSWTWGGGEWVWTPGYWAVTDEPVVVAPAAPVVSGGISVNAGISIH